MCLKENRCKFKIDQITYSNYRSLEQRMTIAKISLCCILKNEGCKKTSLASLTSLTIFSTSGKLKAPIDDNNES